MKDIQLLVRRNNLEGRYNNIYPKTYTDAVVDKESGKPLSEILTSFNMYFLPYTGSVANTRLQVPTSLRRMGLWITYVKLDKTVISEAYIGDKLDDISWKDNTNWANRNNRLVGDIEISSKGTWIVNGQDTGVLAKGDDGITPLLLLNGDELLVSYSNGAAWATISKITNNLHISKYIGADESLPTSGIPVGTIYAKGPTYDENDTNNDNPIYRLWVYAYKGDTLAWLDTGEFTSIAAGVVLEIGTSETLVMSQKVVTELITQLSDRITALESKL